VELRIRELIAGHARADRGAAEPELLHAVYQLLDREVRELKGDRGESDEPIRVCRAEFRESFVLDLDHLRRQVALSAVPLGVDAEGLHVDALRVHLADAPGPHLVDARAPLGVHLQPEQGDSLRDHAVGVHVDRRDAATAHDHFAASADDLEPAAPLDSPPPTLRSRGGPRPSPHPASGGAEKIALGEGKGGRLTAQRAGSRHRPLSSGASPHQTTRPRPY
jgi:hypothetical protein